MPYMIAWYWLIPVAMVAGSLGVLLAAVMLSSANIGESHDNQERDPG